MVNINEKEHPTLHKSVTAVRKQGWRVGLFKDGRPEGLVLEDGYGVPQTRDGVPITHDDDLKLGVYRWIKNEK